MSAEKKFSLNLPLKVILTEEGASHFISHKIKLLRFRLADNIEEYGISLNPFSPQSLQNMILVNYISKIENKNKKENQSIQKLNKKCKKLKSINQALVVSLAISILINFIF